MIRSHPCDTKGYSIKIHTFKMEYKFCHCFTRFGKPCRGNYSGNNIKLCFPYHGNSKGIFFFCFQINGVEVRVTSYRGRFCDVYQTFLDNLEGTKRGNIEWIIIYNS